MATKIRRTKNGNFRLDLSGINEFVYRLQQSKENVITDISKVADDWGKGAKTDYASKISYATGFKSKPAHSNKSPFYEVVENKYANNVLTVSVGHRSFIAKFMEVGTKVHNIPHKTRNGGMTTALVQGISGSRALSKTLDNNRKALAREIERIVTQTILK